MMNRYFDNWERLVTATLRREEDRKLALAHSRDPSFASISSDLSFASPLHDGDAMLISFIELRKATRNFGNCNILESYGGIGPVFKGWINTDTLTAAKPGSGVAVAIKKCELRSIDSIPLHLSHPNLIKLLAYCDEDYKLLLVYEFMPSLFDHLFSGSGGRLLTGNTRIKVSWNTRIKVAIGAARGLSFLHNAENKVIHKNFRSSKIYLDKKFNAKLSGFGLDEEVVESIETPLGEINFSFEHIGYASPEYIDSGDWSKECDVYAFGVVLLELLCGRPALDITIRQQHLVCWAKSYLSNERSVCRVMDPLLEIKYPPHKGILVFATLASRCVSQHPQHRPHMEEVLAELERIKSLSEM